MKVDLDNRLHEILWDAANNPVLYETLERLHLITTRIWFSLLRENYDKEEIVKSIENVADALKSRNSEKMASIMETHMGKTLNLLKHHLV